MRIFPLAGDTDKNDDDFVDDQGEPEEMAVEQSSQVPVTPSVHQTTLSSLRIKANPTNVACQLLELSEEQLQEFAASRNTRKFAPIISKLICFQMSLTERFETLRLEEERVSATPAKPVSQTLLSPLWHWCRRPRRGRQTHLPAKFGSRHSLSKCQRRRSCQLFRIQHHCKLT